MKTTNLLVAGLMLAMAFTLSCSEKCGDKKYDPKTQFCHNNSDVADKCKGKEYNPETQFCGENDIADKCGDKKYDQKTQFCHNNSDVANKCDGKEYNPETQFCGGNEILDKCGGNEYSPETQFCDSRDSVIYKYVKIGDQTWMAVNLNFKAKGSKCYNNKPDNCEKYGRLYNWATALALPSSCNSNDCSSKMQAKHKGVCPNGWHIPSHAEWSDLEKFVGGERKWECEGETDNCADFSTAGKFLKSKTGWDKNDNGTDDFGFSALPGGSGDSDGRFTSIGSAGYWCTSTDEGIDSPDNPYSRVIWKGDNVSTWGGTKSTLFSVRCLKD